MLTGFQARLDASYSSGHQNILHNTYTKVAFDYVTADDSGRYDATNCRWTPVQGEEAPRRVILGAQVLFNGGGATVNSPLVNVKISQMRAGNEVMSAAGQGMPDFGKPGMAQGQATYSFWAEPGDYFECWVMASAATYWQPFPGSWLNTLQIDPHWAHTYWWGVALDESALAALQALVANHGDRLTASEAALTTLSADMLDLQSRVAALEAGGC